MLPGFAGGRQRLIRFPVELAGLEMRKKNVSFGSFYLSEAHRQDRDPGFGVWLLYLSPWQSQELRPR